MSPLMCWKRFVGRLCHVKLCFRRARSLVSAIRTLPVGAVAIALILTLLAHWFYQPLRVQAAFVQASGTETIAPTPDFPLQAHPLPSTLATWKTAQTDDYFGQVEVVPVGYLVWSKFPITVYIQPPTATERATPFTEQRSRGWVQAVSQAVQEWNRYLPLTVVDQAEDADIAVWRSPPPLQVETIPAPKQAPATGQRQSQQPRPTLQIGRARSAVTNYKVYVKGSLKGDLPKSATASKPILAHRCTIQLRPDQAPQYLQAAARHELGHALGIWGHSRSQTDVMYFAQVRNPPPISPRDLNTLKRIYEQPTRLGWALVE